MAVQNSLYNLIKQQSQQKGHPLKIICDWDECLQPLAPVLWYTLIEEKGWTIPNNFQFKDWLHYFWNNIDFYFIHNVPRVIKTPIPEVEQYRETWRKEKFRRIWRQIPKIGKWTTSWDNA